MMLPYTPKFYANGTIFDSIGSPTQEYIDVAWEGNMLCYLRDTTGKVDVLNTITEEVYTTYVQNVSTINSIVVYGGDVYGFSGYNTKIFDDNTVFHVESDKFLVQESLDHSVKNILLSSTNIRDFTINDDLSYYVLHTHNRITKFTKQRQRIYTTQLSVSGSVLSAIMSTAEQPELLAIDTVREYTSVGLKQYPILLGRISNSQMFMAKLDESSGNIHSAKIIPASGEYVGSAESKHVNYNLTNYDQLRRMYPVKERNLTFKLTLKNVYNSREVITVSVPVDTSKFTCGNHHFAFRFNAMSGKIDLFVDGNLHTSTDVGVSNFAFQDIVYDNICVGTTYFYNNIPLFKKLKQPNYYMADNCSVKQFKLYDRALSDDQITVLRRNNILMSDLVASFPCGQRNELDQIERMFSFNVPGSKSNSINIIVKDSDINNEQVKQRVKQVITSKMVKVLPATTRINDIIFKNNTNSFNVRLSS